MPVCPISLYLFFMFLIVSAVLGALALVGLIITAYVLPGGDEHEGVEAGPTEIEPDPETAAEPPPSPAVTETEPQVPAVPAEPETVEQTRMVTSAPPRAEVFMDGRALGRTPLTVRWSNEDGADLELRHPGRETARRHLDDDSPETVHVPMRRAARAAPDLAPL